MNIYAQSFQESHTVSTNDPRFLRFGVSSFTASTAPMIIYNIKQQIQEFTDDPFYKILARIAVSNTYSLYQNNINDQDNFKIINVAALSGLLTALFTTGNFKYSLYVKAASSFVESTIGIIQAMDLLEKFEEYIRVINASYVSSSINKALRETALSYIKSRIIPIQTSKEGCLTISYRIEDISEYDTFFFKIFFLSNPKESIPSNSIAQNKPLIFTATPRSPTGRKYSLQNTNNADIGLYVPSSDDDEDLGDKVSAPLRMTYNNSLGMWESNQQILARLITDLDPVQNNPLDLPEEDADGYIKNDDEFKQFYNNGESRYIGNYTVGLAVPVSTEENKSELFGPNFIRDYGNKTRIEKIKVTNRSNKTFLTGELVLCTLIGSEWIVQEFGKDIPDTSTKLGNWIFSKLIANSDAFFRGENGNLWTFQDYETKARDAWYRKWHDSYGGNEPIFNFQGSVTAIRNNNLDKKDDKITPIDPLLFDPHRSYLLATSFDNIEYIKKINFDEVLAENPDGLYARQIPYWGPAFPDGYKNASIGPVKGDAGKENAPDGSAYWPDQTENIVISFNDKNIPADIAVNSSDSPILPIDFLMQDIEGDIVKACNKYYYNRAWLDGWNLKPINPNRLHFAPLPAELVINTDPYAIFGKDERKNIKTSYLNGIFFNLDLTNINMMSRMFQRYSNYRQGIGRPLCQNTYDTTLVQNATLNSNHIPYDCFVKKSPLSKPAGIPRFIWNFDTDSQYNGLNTVGIIAAINTFGKKRGGSITIEVDQYFGLRPEKQITGSTGSITALLGSIINAVSSTSREFGIPMWGSSSDNYNVFGTTALHVRIFDYWPPEDTVWDTRYFAVLHFNSKTLDDDGNCSVDFAIPTKIDSVTLNLDGSSKKNYSVQDAADPLLSNDLIKLERDKSLWIKDKIRRGKLLTGGGFKYVKRTMSISDKSFVVIRDTEEKDSDLMKSYEFTSKKLSFKLKSTPQVGYNVFSSLDIEFTRDDLKNLMQGEDFLPDDFFGEYEFNGLIYVGFILNIGVASKIIFRPQVRDISAVDLPPKEHGGVRRLTSSSQNGQVVVEGANSVEIPLEANSTDKYQAYFFFHNDITHTLMLDYGAAQVPGFLQYVIANIK